MEEQQTLDELIQQTYAPMLFRFMVLLRNTLCPITCELL